MTAAAAKRRDPSPVGSQWHHGAEQKASTDGAGRRSAHGQARNPGAHGRYQQGEQVRHETDLRDEPERCGGGERQEAPVAPGIREGRPVRRVWRGPGRRGGNRVAARRQAMAAGVRPS